MMSMMMMMMMKQLLQAARQPLSLRRAGAVLG
jgi:hypothetical protein